MGTDARLKERMPVALGGLPRLASGSKPQRRAETAATAEPNATCDIPVTITCGRRHHRVFRHVRGNAQFNGSLTHMNG